MPRYQVTLDGKTFVLEGDHPPSEAEARAAVQGHLGTQPAARSDVQAIGKAESDDPREQIHEPTTFWSGFGQSLLNQMGLGNPDSPLNRAARPQTVGDVGSLLLPNAVDAAIGAGAAAAPVVSKGAQAVKQFADRAGITAGDLLPPVVQRAIPQIIPKTIRALRTPPSALDVGPAARPLGPQLAPDFDRLNVGPASEPFGPTPSPNFGGRLVKGSAVSDQQALADALAELREPSAPVRGTLPPQASLPPGYAPRIVGAKIIPSPSGAAALEAAAPHTADIIPSLEDLKATMPSPESADTPRDWHSGVSDPAAKARMAAAHEIIMDENARYRNATAGERALFQGMPKNYKDALLSRLLGGSQ